MELLDALGSYAAIGVEVLREKALVVIDRYGRLGMHDLVLEMAHFIATEEHSKNPKKHNIVWKSEDVRQILDMGATMKLDSIEAIDHRYLSYKDTQRFLQVAGNMNKLRWIDLHGGKQNNEEGDENIVPLPANFPPMQLCYLRKVGCIPQKQLWEGYKIPDFSVLPNLQIFKLFECPCLEEIDPSIGQLENLVFLYVEGCPRLTMFPSITRIKKLETFTLRRCKKLVKFQKLQQQHEIDHLPHLHLDQSRKEVAFGSNSWSISPCSCCSFRCTSSRPGVGCCLSHYNRNLIQLLFSHTTLRKLDLSQFHLRDSGDEETAIDFGELPNLEELDLSVNPLISPLDFSNRLPRLKYLNVSGCISTNHMRFVQFLKPCLIIRMPSSIAVADVDDCESLRSFRDVLKCKWLWKVSIRGANRLDQCGVDTLINSMLQRNASKDHFMSVALGKHQFPDTFMDRLFWGNICRLHLPDNWYEDSCGFLICIVTDMRDQRIKITMKRENPPFVLSHDEEESDEAKKRIDGREKKTYVGYVPFSSLTQTALLSTSYNTISVATQDYFFPHRFKSFYGGIKLIPRKSKSDEVQHPDCSGYWDTEPKTFTIEQCDAESFFKISWVP